MIEIFKFELIMVEQNISPDLSAISASLRDSAFNARHLFSEFSCNYQNITIVACRHVHKID